jgi:phenylalanyl-tRNA synthetase alpha chain
MDQLEQLREELLAEVANASDSVSLDAVRVSALGKKGRVTAMMKGFGGMDPEARKATGQALNVLKGEISNALEARKTLLEENEISVRLAEETIDVSLPVRPEQEGLKGLTSKTIFIILLL